MHQTTSLIASCGVVIGIIGCIAHGLSMGLPYWFSYNSVRLGVFHKCYENDCKINEIKDEDPLQIYVIRFIFIWSSLILILAVVPGLIAITPCINKKPIKMAGLFFIIAGISNLTSCLVFLIICLVSDDICLGNNCSGSGATSWGQVFGASFYLCWASTALLILAGLLCIIRPPKREKTAKLHTYRASLQRDHRKFAGHDAIILKDFV